MNKIKEKLPKAALYISLHGLVDKMEEMVVNVGEIFLEMKLNFVRLRLAKFHIFAAMVRGIFVSTLHRSEFKKS